eukprot:11219953-Alexandrium_andersonii.AAC.1
MHGRRRVPVRALLPTAGAGAERSAAAPTSGRFARPALVSRACGCPRRLTASIAVSEAALLSPGPRPVLEGVPNCRTACAARLPSAVAWVTLLRYPRQLGGSLYPALGADSKYGGGHARRLARYSRPPR